MALNLRIFFAGVGTTFILLGVGFGGGLMMAKLALEEPTGDRSRASSELPPARVILPSTTEAGLPPHPPKEQQVVAASSGNRLPKPQAQPAKEVVQAPVQQQVDKVDTRKANAEERARRKRVAERKAEQLAAERAKQQHVEPDERPRGPVMAFGGDEPRQSGGFGFFGRE